MESYTLLAQFLSLFNLQHISYVGFDPPLLQFVLIEAYGHILIF